MAEISSNSLQEVANDLELEALTILSNISMPQLTSIGKLSMTALPALQNFTILRNLVQLQELILDNTQISSLEGFGIETIDRVSISNNPYLTSLSFQPINVTGSLTIGARLSIEVELPRLQYAQSTTLRNCSSISIPSLQRMNRSLGLYSNGIEQFNGVPLLQQVEGSLSFVSNSNMTSILLPSLQSIGASGIRYETFTGAVDLEGSFEHISFPNLQTIGGVLSVNSTEDMSCTSLDDLYRSGVVRGNYTCRTANGTADLTTSGGMTTTTSPGSGSQDGGNSSSALRIGLGVGLGVGLGLLLALVVMFFWIRRRKQRRSSQASSAGVFIAEKDGSEIDRANMLDAGSTQEP